MNELRKLQKKELEILTAVVKVCEENNIKYIIMHGTLLGAVRHQGFIPWDDDIDICMPRESYDKFIDIGEKFLPSNLKIQHYKTEENCPNIFAKVRDENTIFLQKEHVDLDINQGVFIDIFPLDRIKKGNHQIAKEYWRKGIFNILNECYDIGYVKGIKRKSSVLIGYSIHFILWKGLWRFVDRNKFIEREDKRRKKLHETGDDCVFYSVDRKIIGKYSRITERKKYLFEGQEFWGPQNYDEVLKKLYGEYMLIPPEKDRITHQPLKVELERNNIEEK